ncbi:Lpg1974 family pore-forming outer membrane protein [Aporhodopirellula aestuarii]|uniref:Lpg1974 family pore-forming outer membrane protein n=1 Tax=Aporhodopirellula aestuarii TaxID=2950107 RepID=A0ABT0U741_9BACT|nr:Lpg1974 family pore-forming outer membrane protein [Aporhodopirellula aestuarii]MCM2372706.1 Lpg1974 family pore-forming outer membrane protein [Aporhodopirellula aestuarii]
MKTFEKNRPSDHDGVHAHVPFRAIVFLTAIVLSVSINMLAGERVAAQQITPEEFASLLGMRDEDTLSEQLVADAKPLDEATKEHVQPLTIRDGSLRTVAFEDYQAVDPVSLQLADLQSQLSAQHMEIGQLRSQLNSPLHSPGRKTPRYYATYESVIVQAVQSNQSAYLIETDDGFAQAIFPWKMEHSPRVEFGVMPAAGKLGYRMRYWQFDHTSSFRADAANAMIPTGYWATVGYHAEDGDIVTGAGFVEDGDFTSSVRADVIDLEVQRSLSLPIDLFAGLRYARIKQGYTALTNESVVSGREDVFSNTEFRGVGPTVAMRFTHRLPLNRLSLFADARGALLLGNQEYAVSDTTNASLQELHAVRVTEWDDLANAFVTNAEIKFGIQYVPVEWLTMRVAMEAQHFGGVGGPNPPAYFRGPDNGLATDSPLDDSLSFYGLSVGLEAGF